MKWLGLEEGSQWTGGEFRPLSVGGPSEEGLRCENQKICFVMGNYLAKLIAVWLFLNNGGESIEAEASTLQGRLG
jgi:hypothetical protein